MKRSVMLQTKLIAPLDTIQMCRDIVEANFNAYPSLFVDGWDSDMVELQARIYTDLEILARNQVKVTAPAIGDPCPDCGVILTGYQGMPVCAECYERAVYNHPDYPEPSSADR